jgi:hypothetical protein
LQLNPLLERAKAGFSWPPKAELTRELASDLLNQHLAEPNLTMVQFNAGGVQMTEHDGIIQRFGPPALSQWTFTAKGLQMFGTHIGQDTRAASIDGSSNPSFRLKVGLAQRVTEVTGIADGPTPNLKEVQYNAAYIFPSEIPALSTYIYGGRNGARTVFQKYDDGW